MFDIAGKVIKSSIRFKLIVTRIIIRSSVMDIIEIKIKESNNQFNQKYVGWLYVLIYLFRNKITNSV